MRKLAQVEQRQIGGKRFKERDIFGMELMETIKGTLQYYSYLGRPVRWRYSLCFCVNSLNSGDSVNEENS